MVMLAIIVDGCKASWHMCTYIYIYTHIVHVYIYTYIYTFKGVECGKSFVILEALVYGLCVSLASRVCKSRSMAGLTCPHVVLQNECEKYWSVGMNPHPLGLTRVVVWSILYPAILKIIPVLIAERILGVSRMTSHRHRHGKPMKTCLVLYTFTCACSPNYVLQNQCQCCILLF